MATEETQQDTVVILTPMKDALRQLETYFEGLRSLTFPRSRTALGILESDSQDNTWERLLEEKDRLEREFAALRLVKRDFGFHLPAELPRWDARVQVARRSVLAKSRNHLLFHALRDEKWVLWLDSDVSEYPDDIVERLLATGKEVVQPNCVYDYGGQSFDLNAWRDQGRFHLHDLKAEGDLVRLDSVGGTMLLVRADRHRDGLVFPAFPYGLRNPAIRTNNYWLGELETEGLGIMAADMGVECWGMPNLEIRHHRF
jgi:peptide chain release factor subunit 1